MPAPSAGSPEAAPAQVQEPAHSAQPVVEVPAQPEVEVPPQPEAEEPTNVPAGTRSQKDEAGKKEEKVDNEILLIT